MRIFAVVQVTGPLNVRGPINVILTNLYYGISPFQNRFQLHGLKVMIVIFTFCYFLANFSLNLIFLFYIEIFEKIDIWLCMTIAEEL